MLDSVFVLLDEYGFVAQAMITANPPSGAISAPGSISGMQELHALAYYFAEGTWSNLGVAPANHILDKTSKAWVLDLEGVRERVWGAFKAQRQQLIDAPMATPYGVFDCDAKSRTNITDTVLLLQTLSAIGQPGTVEFTLANNSNVTLDLEKIITVGLLLGAKTQAAHGTARLLRSTINAATTVEDLETITWPT